MVQRGARLQTLVRRRASALKRAPGELLLSKQLRKQCPPHSENPTQSRVRRESKASQRSSGARTRRAASMPPTDRPVPNLRGERRLSAAAVAKDQSPGVL